MCYSSSTSHLPDSDFATPVRGSTSKKFRLRQTSGFS